MQKLTINGFLGIKKSEIILDGLTVLIGQQASGKSIIARLFYFFDSYLYDFENVALIKREHKKTYDKNKKQTFSQVFPPYSWENDSFNIRFERDDFCITISSKEDSKNIEIETSESVTRHYNNLKKQLIEIGKVAKKSLGDDALKLPSSVLIRHFNLIKNDLDIKDVENVLFVPAARSFYAAIREEIFSILSIDEKIDQIIMQFGEFYEAAKRRIPENQTEIFNKVLKGRYIRNDGNDWIETDRGRIEVSKASSGQQESLPLLIALSIFPKEGRTLIIEEPEAHLFPDAQVSVIDFIVRQSKMKKTDILITTHSPYILSALNNCIIRDLLDSKNPLSISIDKVKAYSLQRGVSRSIIDKDNNIVSAEYIDSISDSITNDYIQMLDKLNEN